MGDLKTIGLTASDSDELNESTKAMLFGVLAELAWPIIDNYKSDLYHDARWIDELTGPATFYFSPRESGTWLSEEPWWMETTGYNDPTYELTLRRQRFSWVVDLEEVL